MKTYTTDELNDILSKHELWLKDDQSGVRADLSDANLSGADLSDANLSYANLSYTNLRGADLSYANLSYANLRGANLRGANLSDANISYASLRGANLRGADLSYANLSGADLSDANLSDANLRDANLSDANLHGTNLSYANLSHANLRGADLSGADLSYAKNLNCPIACPEEGSFIAFKKAYNVIHNGGCIIKLEIPNDALRCSATSRKCRCSKAKVISITNIDGTEANVDAAYSGYDSEFEYRVGEIVKVDNFDTDRWHECAPGIHFFITRKEAVDY